MGIAELEIQFQFAYVKILCKILGFVIDRNIADLSTEVGSLSWFPPGNTFLFE